MTTLTLEILIGCCAEVEGKWLEVIEIIHDGPQVVLKQTDAKNTILNNQYGEASSHDLSNIFSAVTLSTLNDGPSSCCKTITR